MPRGDVGPAFAIIMPKYNETALHFDVPEIPRLLEQHLPSGPLAFADFGCGDGPLFAVLARRGVIGPSKPVYAVDLEASRLARVAARFPFITTTVAPADAVPAIPDGSLDLVISTMVMEHVPDERRYLDEIKRTLRPGGRAFLTTVYKKPWAWYFRQRDGERVLDTSHLREYTDLDAFRELVMEGGRFRRLHALATEQLWFPLLDPVLFRLAARSSAFARSSALRLLRRPKVPIPGYFALEMMIER